MERKGKIVKYLYYNKKRSWIRKSPLKEETQSSSQQLKIKQSGNRKNVIHRNASDEV